ncbi:MAG TPA: ATP-binding protein [Thermodesulfobacteriota bacterium]|nr:ATP-binding protein [Thermodesulfobacteriota bacterium]
MFRSLFLKVSLSVGLVITLTLASFAYFLMENQKEHLLDTKKKEIEILSTLVSNWIANFMLEGRAQDFHNFFGPFRVREEQLELRILDPSGAVLLSSQRNEKGISMAYLLAGHPDLSGKTPMVREQWIQGRPFFSSLQALENQPSCFSCHGEDKKILGLLNVALPMEMTHRSIAFNRNLLIASTAITLLLMAAAINFLLTRLVKKPIALLIETMSQVEKGNLNVEVNLGTRDELGHLGRSFSSMVQKLSLAQKELEKQQQQQMLQVKHLASLGELAASVAHEVKNPLAGIKLAIQVLAKEPCVADSQRETIEEIVRSIDRLDKTITDLLSYSRISPPALSPVNLHEVIEAALFSVKEEAHIAGVRVEKLFDLTLPLLPLDSRQMEGVFLNLFLNALQAMPQGGVLTVQTKRRESGHPRQENPPGSPGSEEGWVEVTVTDTGEGIPPEVLGEVFRPFFTTKAKGTGLGLSLVQRVVEQHHGQVFVQSGTGVGTTFYLLLPISPQPPKGEPV